MLIEEGAEKNVQELNDSTPMHLALVFGFVETAMLLVDMGARIDIKNHINESPYEMALAKGYDCVVEHIKRKFHIE